MPKSNQTDRNKKYKEKYGIRQVKVDLKPDEIEMLDTGKEKYDLTRKDFIVKCCKYCIDNGIKFDD